MGSIGPLEVVVILVVALLVLGPTRLPDAARSVGKAMAELRRMTSGFQSEVRDAFSDPPARTSKPAATVAEPVALPARPEQADVTDSLQMVSLDKAIQASTTPETAGSATAGPDAAEPLAAEPPVPAPPAD